MSIKARIKTDVKADHDRQKSVWGNHPLAEKACVTRARLKDVFVMPSKDVDEELGAGGLCESKGVGNR